MDRRGWTLMVVLSIASALAVGWQLFRAVDPSPVPTPPNIGGEAPATTPARAESPPDHAAAPSGKPNTGPQPTAASPITPADALAEVRALVNKGSIGAARALAERYLQQIPDGEEAAQIKSLTGVHPHP